MDISRLKKKIGLNSKYDRWFDESIEILERNRFLKIEGAYFVVH